MSKIFNVSADCKPNQHYMVDISEKLEKIKVMIDRGDYFTINRARQYGKTTTLKALNYYLQKDYTVVSLDFQKLSHKDFENENSFVEALSREIIKKVRNTKSVPYEIFDKLLEFSNSNHTDIKLAAIFECFSRWCEISDKQVLLIIDEVDSATNNQVFLDFLAQLRGYYIDREDTPTFQSVILAGVYDVKNLKRKFTQDGEQKINSPWNIAADFLVDMSFSAKDIARMLTEYEDDYHTRMDIEWMAGLIYKYTAGYPFLVSRICKLIDERTAGSMDYPDKSNAWTKNGFLDAVKILLAEKNTLFESLVSKLTDYPELRDMLYSLLFTGKTIPYNPLYKSIEVAEMFGFVKNIGGNAVISNRVFETLLYNLFLSEEVLNSEMYGAALKNKNQFIRNDRLNMKLILEKFVTHFDDIYGDQNQKFLEEDGRRYFLLYLKPIINGIGNYYIEAQTRDMKRTDVIVDYHGEQFVVEMKIWHGDEYNTRGETQLSEYLNHYHLKKGYMLSFNFNKKKKIGVKEINVGDKLLVEAVV